MHVSSFLRLIVSIVALQAVAKSLVAEDLDLAKQKPGDVVSIPVSSGRVPVRVINRVPTREYRVSVVREVRSIDALPFVPPGGFAAADVCQRLLDKAEGLRVAGLVEADVSGIVSAVKGDLHNCDDPAFLTKIDQELASTIMDLGEYELPHGTQLTISVSRDDSGKTLTWVKVLQTEERGRWLTLYGFGVVPSRDDRYFLAPAGEGKFTITQEDKRRGYRAVPSVFFMWLPRKFQGSDWSHGFTAGFGVKNDQPALSVGYSVLHNWNIGLVGGVSLGRELRLNGRYKSPQEVTENLAEDALHAKVLQTRAMIAVVFRFGSNPFAGSDQGEGKSEPTKTKAGDEAKGK
jgi:hypothetical protein